MANVLKLVYIDEALSNSLTWLQNNSTDTTKAWNNSGNDYYRSLVFTKDGHLLTHGIDFGTVQSYGPGLIYNSGSSNTVTSSSKPTSSATAYYFPKINNNSNTITVDWVDVSTIVTTSGLASWTGSSNIATVGTITSGTWHGSVVDVEHGGTGTNTFTEGLVLIGHGTSAVGTKAIETSLNGVDSNNSNLITAGAVKAAIDNVLGTADAFVFKGLLSNNTALPTSGYSAGWTYKASTDGYIVIKTGETNFGKFIGSNTYPSGLTADTDYIVLEAGDLVIATSDAGSSLSAYNASHWSYVLTNIDGALTNANLGYTTSNLNRAVLKDSTTNTLYVEQLMRAVQVEGTNKIANTSNTALNFKGGTGITASYDGGVKFSLTDISDLSAVTTAGIYKIKYNRQGQITGTTSWDPNTFTLKSVLSAYNSSSAGSDKTYDPDGTSLSLAAGRGLSLYLDNNIPTIGHKNQTTASNLTANGRTYVTGLTFDSYGHVTGYTTATETVENTNTWRPVWAYQITTVTNPNDTHSGSLILAGSTDTKKLAFGSEFAYYENDNTTDTNTSEIHLVWAEVSASGTLSYHV